jgi:hypothetical protein
LLFTFTWTVQVKSINYTDLKKKNLFSEQWRHASTVKKKKNCLVNSGGMLQCSLNSGFSLAAQRDSCTVNNFFSLTKHLLSVFLKKRNLYLVAKRALRGRNEKDLHGLDKRGPSTLIRVFINGLLTDFIEGNPKMSHFNSMDQYNRGRTWILMWSDLYWIHDPKFRKPSWYYWSETHLIKILKMFAYTVHVACNNRPSSFWNMRKIHWIGCFSFNYGPLIFNYNINLKQVPARDLYFFFLFSFFF